MNSFKLLLCIVLIKKTFFVIFLTKQYYCCDIRLTTSFKSSICVYFAYLYSSWNRIQLFINHYYRGFMSPRLQGTTKKCVNLILTQFLFTLNIFSLLVYLFLLKNKITLIKKVVLFFKLILSLILQFLEDMATQHVIIRGFDLLASFF